MELTGRTLGHYRVLEKISRGGMLDRDRIAEAQRKITS